MPSHHCDKGRRRMLHKGHESYGLRTKTKFQDKKSRHRNIWQDLLILMQWQKLGQMGGEVFQKDWKALRFGSDHLKPAEFKSHLLWLKAKCPSIDSPCIWFENLISSRWRNLGRLWNPKELEPHWWWAWNTRGRGDLEVLETSPISCSISAASLTTQCDQLHPPLVH